MKNNVKTLSLCLGLASLALGQTTTAPIYQMSILAGIPTPNSNGDGGPSSFATVSSPQAIVVDKNGNIFIADSNNNRIREISATTGVISTYTSSGISSPSGLAFDNEGNLWVSQTGNNGQIIELTTDSKGAVTTTVIAGGNVTGNYGADGQNPVNAFLNSPQAIAIDANDDVFIADASNNRIREIANTNNCIHTPQPTANNTTYPTSCVIRTIAGGGATPSLGSTSASDTGTNTVGDGGLALLARVQGPAGIAVTSDGSKVYFSDTSDQRIRVIDMVSGIINSLVGTCSSGTKTGSPGVATTGPGGTVIPCPSGDYGDILGGSGATSTLHDGQIGTTAAVNNPRGLFLDSANNKLYFADTNSSTSGTTASNRIRVVDLNTGVVNTVIGGGGTSGDVGVKLGSGALTNLSLDTPYAVYLQGGLIYFVEQGSTNRVRVADPVGQTVTTLTSQPRSTGSGGPATGAYLGFATSLTSSGSPRVAVDNAGNVYVIEASMNRIRQVNSSGIINDWAGTGASGSTGDTGPAVAARLNAPQALAFDSKGNGYIADTGNSRIRMVTPAGVITTVAGRSQMTSCSTLTSKDNNGNACNPATFVPDKSKYQGDGGPAVNAVLQNPQSVAVDANDNLIIADTANQAIRYVNMTTGIITTIAGGQTAGIPGGPTDGRSGTGASGYNDSSNALYGLFKDVRGVAADSKGDIYTIEWSNPAGRELVPSGGHYILNTIYGSGSDSGSAPSIPTGTGAASIPAKLRIGSGNGTSIAVDTGGNIYYALGKDQRVTVITADHSAIYQIAGGGSNDTGLNYTSSNGFNLEVPNVTGVAVDSKGVVYTADRTGLVRKLVCTKNCLPLK